MMSESNKEFDQFIDALVDELIAMPDSEVMEGTDGDAVQADGMRLLDAARRRAAQARGDAAQAGMPRAGAHTEAVIASVTPEEARQFLARAWSDGRYTLAARSVGDMTDEETLSLYTKLRCLEADDGLSES